MITRTSIPFDRVQTPRGLDRPPHNPQSCLMRSAAFSATIYTGPYQLVSIPDLGIAKYQLMWARITAAGQTYLCMSVGDNGEYTGVHYSDSTDAVHSQVGVDHATSILGQHAACPTRVIDIPRHSADVPISQMYQPSPLNNVAQRQRP